MTLLEFTNRDQQTITAYSEVVEGQTADSPSIKTSYPAFLKVLKFHFAEFSKSIMFLNRYLSPNITDDAQLQLLSENLETYLIGRGSTQESFRAWCNAHNAIQLLLDDETLFIQSITRENNLDPELYTENENTDENKFSTIIGVQEIDDGSKSLFIEEPLLKVSDQPAP